MASTARIAPTPIATPDLNSMFALSTSLAESCAQVQRMQLDALLAWQKSLASAGQELCDEWVCRFGGGVPIDV